MLKFNYLENKFLSSPTGFNPVTFLPGELEHPTIILESHGFNSCWGIEKFIF